LSRPETPLSELERVALKVRHSAAVVALKSEEGDRDPYGLLCEVVAPSEGAKVASERRARELLERAAG
jgi:hypothetical protein